MKPPFLPKLILFVILGLALAANKHQSPDLRDSLINTNSDEIQLGDTTLILEQARKNKIANTIPLPHEIPSNKSQAKSAGCPLKTRTLSLTKTIISPDQIFKEEDVLTNEGISAPRTQPLYRGDGRHYNVIFNEGFKPRSPLARTSLLKHIDFVIEPETQWISTSLDLEATKGAAYSNGPNGYGDLPPGNWAI